MVVAMPALSCPRCWRLKSPVYRMWEASGSPTTPATPQASRGLVGPARPLGCRIYFCDQAAGAATDELYERFHREIAEIHERHGLTYVYKELLLHPLFFGESS